MDTINGCLTGTHLPLTLVPRPDGPGLPALWRGHGAPAAAAALRARPRPGGGRHAAAGRHRVGRQERGGRPGAGVPPRPARPRPRARPPHRHGGDTAGVRGHPRGVPGHQHAAAQPGPAEHARWADDQFDNHLNGEYNTRWWRLRVLSHFKILIIDTLF